MARRLVPDHLRDVPRRVSPPWHPRTPARIGWAFAAAALVVLAGVAVRWDRPPRDAEAVAAERADLPATMATATTLSPPATTPASSTTALANRPVTTARHAVTPTTPAVRPIDPGALVAPTPGTYPTRVVVNGSETSGTLAIASDQVQRRSTSSATRVDALAWTAAGAALVANGEPGQPGSCQWSVPALSVPTELAEGRTWSSDVTCSTTAAGQRVDVQREEWASVTHRARTTVARAPVDTWIIERHVLLTVRADRFTSVTESASSELFAPSLGVPVYVASRTDIPQADGSIESVLESEELLSSAPTT